MTLSGGERARADLAAIILSRFDLLLLDEPTNDLDFDGLARLERFLDSYQGALVVVSHDREFLDRTVDRIASIEPDTRHVREWAGGWTDYGMLLGAIPLVAGTRTVGRRTVIGAIGQARGDYTVGASLLEEFISRTGLAPVDARKLLAKFGLGADHVSRPCSTLSPGERTRVHLAELQARGVNLLVLDEPTNHLDIEAVEQLESALGSYDGTLVVVSHDRRFLERVAPTRELELDAPRLISRSLFGPERAGSPRRPPEPGRRLCTP